MSECLEKLCAGVGELNSKAIMPLLYLSLAVVGPALAWGDDADESDDEGPVPDLDEFREFLEQVRPEDFAD